MKGFDEQFADFPDYIIGITHEIWEERGLGAKMRRHYHPDVIVRTPGGISVGEPASTAATMSTLIEFPDRVLLGEDVIWSGDEDAGMLSSHRILSTATHQGDGYFGAATGKSLTYRAIADCYAHENMISDEWLVRDNGGAVRQMGQNPRDWAAAKIASQGGPESAARPFAPAMDIEGPYLGRGNDNPWGAKYADLLGRIMTAEFSVIPAEWDRACHLEYPGAVTAHGHGAADAFWLGLRASFPDAVFTCEHVIGREDPLMPPRAALRWSLFGKHAGWGTYGAPSGAEVYVMGLSHAEFGPSTRYGGGLRREYVLYDETAVWTQILLHQG